MAKKRLAQALADKLDSMVQELTDSQLQDTLRDCNWCSETNCGWIEHRLAPTVYEVVDNEIVRRLTAGEDTDTPN